MIRLPRLRSLTDLRTLGCLVGLVACVGPGCHGKRGGDDGERRTEYRKALLAAENRRQEREVLHEKARVQDDHGAAIESDEVVAGIRLPRGLTLRLGFEREWYYETTLPLEVLQAYFGTRLMTQAVIQGGAGTVTYKDALPRDTPTSQRVSVRLGPLPGQRGKNEVNIRLPPKFVRRTPAEVALEAKLGENFPQ